MKITKDKVLSLLIENKDYLNRSGRYWGNGKEVTCKDCRRDLFYALRAIKSVKGNEIKKFLKKTAKKYLKISDVVNDIFK